MLNLDTHILIFALTGQVTRKEEKALKSNEWCISDIVLWEITKLIQLGRIELDLKDSAISSVLAKMKTFPIDMHVCEAMLNLDFKSDPADEIIAATSVAYNIPLLTRDKVIRKSKLVVFL